MVLRQEFTYPYKHVTYPYHGWEDSEWKPRRRNSVEYVYSTRGGWNCVGWVKDALELLKADPRALVTSVIEWEIVRDAAMAYC
jgi:hypothetical protein